jgi:hypothetical protein
MSATWQSSRSIEETFHEIALLPCPGKDGGMEGWENRDMPDALIVSECPPRVESNTSPPLLPRPISSSLDILPAQLERACVRSTREQEEATQGKLEEIEAISSPPLQNRILHKY